MSAGVLKQECHEKLRTEVAANPPCYNLMMAGRLRLHSWLKRIHLWRRRKQRLAPTAPSGRGRGGAATCLVRLVTLHSTQVGPNGSIHTDTLHLLCCESHAATRCACDDMREHIVRQCGCPCPCHDNMPPLAPGAVRPFAV